MWKSLTVLSQTRMMPKKWKTSLLVGSFLTPDWSNIEFMAYDSMKNKVLCLHIQKSFWILHSWLVQYFHFFTKLFVSESFLINAWLYKDSHSFITPLKSLWNLPKKPFGCVTRLGCFCFPLCLLGNLNYKESWFAWMVLVAKADNLLKLSGTET